MEYCGLEKPFVGSPACDHGTHYEDESIEYYGNSVGGVNHEFGLIPYNAIPYESLSPFGKTIRDLFPVEDYYFLAGSPDGIMVYDGPGGPQGVIEAKCPYRRRIKFGEVPEYYVPQCMLNMIYCDLPFTDYIEYYPPGYTRVQPSSADPVLNAVRLYEDLNWAKEVFPKLKEFWNEVEHYRSEGIETHPLYYKYKKKRVLNLK